MWLCQRWRCSWCPPLAWSSAGPRRKGITLSVSLEDRGRGIFHLTKFDICLMQHHNDIYKWHLLGFLGMSSCSIRTVRVTEVTLSNLALVSYYTWPAFPSVSSWLKWSPIIGLTFLTHQIILLSSTDLESPYGNIIGCIYFGNLITEFSCIPDTTPSTWTTPSPARIKSSPTIIVPTRTVSAKAAVTATRTMSGSPPPKVRTTE